jgi:hypothetical protein
VSPSKTPSSQPSTSPTAVLLTIITFPVQFTLSGNNVNSTSFFIKGLNLAVKSALETSLKLNHYSKITVKTVITYTNLCRIKRQSSYFILL